MKAEKLPYGNRIFFVYVGCKSGEQSHGGFVRPMCMEEFQLFGEVEELFERIYSCLECFTEYLPSEESVVLRDYQCVPFQKYQRFYAVEVFCSQRGTLQGFIRGKEYPGWTAFQDREEFCQLISGRKITDSKGMSLCGTHS